MNLVVLIGGTEPRGPLEVLADADVAVAIWTENHKLQSTIVKDREGDTTLTVRHAKLKEVPRG